MKSCYNGLRYCHLLHVAHVAMVIAIPMRKQARIGCSYGSVRPCQHECTRCCASSHQLVAGRRRGLRNVPDDEIAVCRAARKQVRAARVELQALDRAAVLAQRRDRGTGALVGGAGRRAHDFGRVPEADAAVCQTAGQHARLASRRQASARSNSMSMACLTGTSTMGVCLRRERAEQYRQAVWIEPDSAPCKPLKALRGGHGASRRGHLRLRGRKIQPEDLHLPHGGRH